MGLLGYMVVLFLVFEGISILSSIVTISIYIPTELVNFEFIFYVHSKHLLSYSFESLYLLNVTLKFKPLFMICEVMIDLVSSHLAPCHLATLLLSLCPKSIGFSDNS